MMNGMNHSSYPELLHAFAPRPIRGETEYKTTQTEVDRLMDRDSLSVDEKDYLDLLGTLILDYERRYEDRTQYEIRGIELIKGLLELHELTLTDLIPIFKNKSIASAVLNRHRHLTVDHINHLAAFFSLPHSLFFEPLEFNVRKTAELITA